MEEVILAHARSVGTSTAASIARTFRRRPTPRLATYMHHRPAPEEECARRLVIGWVVIV